ncbi:MAG: hypothetical protein QF681_10475 [Vicinamibacterales bacterium]|jgi:uncharacterized protein YjeT (DUF2065 family)|nr:hypothetical protein [Vicinamibacterales bacterium]
MSVAIVLIVLGVLVIATRAPLIFAPARTIELYRTLITGHPKAFGAILILTGLAIVIALAGETGTAAAVLTFIGWWLVVFSLLPLLVPSAMVRFMTLILSLISAPAVARSIGVLAVVIGALIAYYGFTLL